MADSLAGKLLVAMPGIGDPRFDHSVIMMCSHDAEHGMGVIVNKPKALTLAKVLGHLGIPAAPEITDRMVLDGGPVRPDRGFVLHSQDFIAAEATRPVAPGISLTATRDVLEAVARQDEAPMEFVVALGCSSWSAGQLESELRHNAWLVVDADRAIVFDDEHTHKWARALALLGVDAAMLSNSVGSA